MWLPFLFSKYDSSFDRNLCTFLSGWYCIATSNAVSTWCITGKMNWASRAGDYTLWVETRPALFQNDRLMKRFQVATIQTDKIKFPDRRSASTVIYKALEIRSHMSRCDVLSFECDWIQSGGNRHACAGATHKSVPVIFEPPCIYSEPRQLTFS
jgi:hypothetical protein